MVLYVFSMSAQPAVAGKGMARIKGGSYLPLYSADTQRITVKTFNMDIYPVTNADYLVFLSKYPDWKRSRMK